MIAPKHYVGDSLNMTHYHEYIMCSTNCQRNGVDVHISTVIQKNFTIPGALNKVVLLYCSTLSIL